MKLFVAVVWVLFVSVCHGGAAGEQAEHAVPALMVDSLLVLTNANRTAQLHLSKGYPKAKFVEVQISKVSNPKLYTLIFEVHYREKEGEDLLLGTFALYPANHPGRFIVATKGVLKKQGDVLVSYLLPENYNEHDAIRVEIKTIRLSDGNFEEKDE